MKKIVLSMALIVSAFCATANDAIKNSSPLELQPNMVISTEDYRENLDNLVGCVFLGTFDVFIDGEYIGTYDVYLCFPDQ